MKWQKIIGAIGRYRTVPEMDGGSLAKRVGHHPEHLAVLGEMLGEHSSLVQQLRHFLA
jgi:hypothetical protein